MDDHTLYWIKGLIALAGLCLLLVHMLHTREPMSTAKRLRYVGLLMASGTITYASQRQIATGPEWTSIQWGAFLTALVILIAAICSLIEEQGPRLSSTLRSLTHG